METLEQVIPGRQVPPDLKYGSRLVEKLTNYVMMDGKKSVARKIVYRAFELLEERSGEPGLDIFYKAVTNCSPRLETRSRRVGGAAYQVPFEVPADRQRTLALRWIVRATRARGERTMAERLTAELLAASGKEGKAYEKKLEAHRMAEANRPFAHYRW
jgi:small subunit ribosomal protein S7